VSSDTDGKLHMTVSCWICIC